MSLHAPEQTDGKGKSRPLYDLQPGWPEAILARIAELWNQTDDGEAAPSVIEAADTTAPVTSSPEPAPAVDEPPAIRSFQADALLAGILDAEIDLSQFGEADSKGVVASIIGATPTVASLNKKGVAAE